MLVFLGIPLGAGFLTRTLGERARGRARYETRFVPRIAPAARYGLLSTIVLLFAPQGEAVTSRPGDVARIALPLLACFALMFGGSLLLGLRLRIGYAKTSTPVFTAAGNTVELAIAVAIGTFGVTSGQALAGAVGPLIECRPRRARPRGPVGRPPVLPRRPDVVITISCGDVCPVLPGKRYLDWPLEDPAGKGVEAVRPIRDELGSRIRGLLADLHVPVRRPSA